MVRKNRRCLVIIKKEYYYYYLSEGVHMTTRWRLRYLHQATKIDAFTTTKYTGIFKIFQEDEYTSYALGKIESP